MGAGKRIGPVKRGHTPRRGLTETEVYAELVYAGVPLDKIASMTDAQISQLYFRPRNKWGRLKRKHGKRRSKGRPVSWQDMFRRAWEKQGLTPEEIEIKWQDKLVNARTERNPTMSCLQVLTDNPGAQY